MHDRGVPGLLDRCQAESDAALGEMGALAASITALEPDLLMLASRVRMALSLFEERFAGDEPSVIERYELDRYSMGAAALYDAVVDMSELLMNAVAGVGLGGPLAVRDWLPLESLESS